MMDQRRSSSASETPVAGEGDPPLRVCRDSTADVLGGSMVCRSAPGFTRTYEYIA